LSLALIVSLRWFSGRLQMGHYTNANGGTRKMKADVLRQFQQARAKLQLSNTTGMAI
jgi:hypothetical protein